MVSATFNDCMTWLAIGAVLGTLATFTTSGSFDSELPLNILVGAAGAMLADNLAFPAMGLPGTVSHAYDADRLLAAIAGAVLLVAAINLYFKDETSS